MKFLWVVTLLHVHNINIVYGINENETYKSLEKVKLEANENELSYKTETVRSSSKSLKFSLDFVPRKKRCTIQRKIPEYLNTFAIPAKNELSKVANDEASDWPPSSSKKNVHDITQNHCVECNVTFRYDTHYANHCKRVHGITQPFPCGHCERSFSSRAILGNHVNAEHGLKNNPYVHWKKNEAIVCDACRETIIGWRKFEEHALSKHVGEKLMSCSHCPEKFHRRKQLLHHEKLKHKHLEIKCAICKNIFERSDALKKHSEFCEQRQTQNKMGDNQVDTIIHYGMLVCEECGDEHKTNILLREHLRLKHPHVKLHPCEHCDAAFSSVKTLEKHVCMFHPDKTSKIKKWRKFKRGAIYECEYCKENFTGTVQYEKHGKQHPGLPMFRCKDCGKGYSWRKCLRNHANEVHGNVKKRCSFCSKCYFRLWTHEKRCQKTMENKERKRMAGYPKHFCGICSQDLYMTDSSFKNHVNLHKYLECCSICGQRFLRGRGGLKEHMERKHPFRENIEALLRTADEVRTFVKSEKKQYTNDGTEGFDIRTDFYEVKTEAPGIYVKLEDSISKGSE